MISIVLASDDNFVQHCMVTMSSVLKNNTDVHFYLFTEGLKERNSSSLNSFVKSKGGQLTICTINSSVIKDFPMPKSGGEHISVATYYRLFVERFLPSEIQRVIYMDCDMVVRGSLSDLWETDLTGKAMGAVYQACSAEAEKDLGRLNIPIDEGYFNAGLLLINLDYWRSHDVTNRLFAFIRMHSNLIKQHDQDVLNAVLYKEVKAISYTWNFLPLFINKFSRQFPIKADYSITIEYPIVIHYVSVPKPWEYGCSNPYKNEYYKYLKMTPYYEFKPKFVLKKFIKNVLYPRLIVTINRVDVLKLRKYLYKS